MKRGFVFISVLAGMIFGLNANAQNRVMTFEEAVKIALKNSVLLNIQRNNLEYSQMQKMSSIAGVGPSVSVSAAAYQVNGNSFNQNAGKVINGIRDNVNGTISANLNLFSGFNRINSIRQFSNQLEAQSYFVNRTAQDVINTVSTQYLNVMLDVELLVIARKNFDAQSKQLQQITEQVNLGARSPVDQYNQDALTKAAELRFVQADVALGNDKSLLAQTLLLDAFDDFDVERPSWDVNEIGSQVLNAEQLADNAKQFRGDYLRAVKAESGQRFAMIAARGLMLPSLYAFGNLGSAYNYQHGVPKLLYDSSRQSYVNNTDYPRPFAEQFKTNNVYKSYGLQMNLTLFNGLQNRTAFVQQKVLYDNSQLNRKNLEYQIRNDIVRAVRNFDGAKKAFTVSVDQLKSAEIAFGFETERYNLGVTNFVDFTNANRVYVQAETDKAQAEYRLVFQKILLEYAAGTLKPENIQK
ncbi:MAG TPA: TolC family protein [Cyclobacteriaceae bacterium]|nr:TolC family protein [Cyclobacteriaceae bacterium]